MTRGGFKRELSKIRPARTALFLAACVLLLAFFAEAFAYHVFRQKLEIAACYAARRWQLESHRNVDFDYFDQQVLRRSIEREAARYLEAPGTEVEVARARLWNVVSLSARFAGLKFKAEKFVASRDRPVPYLLPGRPKSGAPTR